MSYYVIEDIRRNRTDLQPSSDYINYLSGKRIKTLNLKYKADVEPLEMENVNINSLSDDEPFKYEFTPDSDHDDDISVMKYEIDEDISNVIDNNDAYKSDIATEYPEKPLDTDPVPKAEENAAVKENDTVFKNLFTDSNDSSNGASIVMDIDVEIVKVNDDDVDENNTTTRSKRTAKKKDNKKEAKEINPDSKHRFVGIIREPKGELSKGNWETKLLTEEEAIEQFNKKEFDSKYERMEFKCTKCFKGFSKNEMLLRHNKMWHEQVRD